MRRNKLLALGLAGLLSLAAIGCEQEEEPGDTGTIEENGDLGGTPEETPADDLGGGLEEEPVE